MALNITQQELDRTDLVVLVGGDGIVQWSAKGSREQVAAMLHASAGSIKDGTL
jgi:hypothetical protein